MILEMILENPIMVIWTIGSIVGIIIGIILIIKKKYLKGIILTIISILVFIFYMGLWLLGLFSVSMLMSDNGNKYIYPIDDIVPQDSLNSYILYQHHAGGASDTYWHVTKKKYENNFVPKKIQITLEQELNDNIIEVFKEEDIDIIFEDFRDSGEPYFFDQHLQIIANILVFKRGGLYRGLFDINNNRTIIKPITAGHPTEDSIRFHNSMKELNTNISIYLNNVEPMNVVTMHNYIDFDTYEVAVMGEIINNKCQGEIYTAYVDNEEIYAGIECYNSLAHGNYFHYSQDGSKRTVGRYIKGKMHGRWIVLRWGVKVFEVNYKNGKKDGKYTKYYNNGNKKSEEYYKDGELLN